MQDATKRKLGKVLRFAVSGALLVATPVACGSSQSPQPLDTREINEPPQREEHPNESPPEQPEEEIANEPPMEPIPGETTHDEL
ncbi:MAG: hypothetical protein IT379_07450 [Deltaproteobacteria bacterium]|nr:hypothetical protein [Deltaproteobacteria bacterium]